jgi:UDP-N-acetyl-D-mannosaminuronate dehydrogenase
MKNKSLIIGFGEIGKSLYAALNENGYDVHHRDIEQSPILDDIHVLHICFPYSKNFVKSVLKYKKLYNPRYTIIHSTVPIGTSKKCDCYYSPVRGIHPHLERSLTTFVKYLAPSSSYLKKYFRNAGVPIKENNSRETLEAMKLYCTTIYGINIIAEKEVWNFCKKNGLDYDTVYTDCATTYNDGYQRLGFPQFSKYVLKHKDGKIGGHCVLPNCKLLGTELAKFITKQNKKL